MKQFRIILLLLILSSCDDKITLFPEDVKIEGKTVTFPEDSNRHKWKIVTASDGHDYMENDGGPNYIIMHYVECVKCKKDSL